MRSVIGRCLAVDIDERYQSCEEILVDLGSETAHRAKRRLPRVSLGRKQLLLAGMETHICVCQTVLGALEKSYAAHVVSDAVGSRTEANHRIGLARMERAGALVSSTEMAVYELPGRSDTAAFKEMLPLLK